MVQFAPGSSLSPDNAMYNSVSRYMDVSDSMMESFRFRHRQTRWTHTALWFAMQLILHNAFVMHCEAEKEQPLTHEDFLVSLATSLRDLGLSMITSTLQSQVRAASPSTSPQKCSTRTAEIDLFSDSSGVCVRCPKRRQRFRCSQCHNYFCIECLRLHWGLSEE